LLKPPDGEQRKYLTCWQIVLCYALPEFYIRETGKHTNLGYFMKRRDFLTGVLSAVALTPIVLSGCGKEGDDTGEDTSADTTGTTVDDTSTTGTTTDTGGGTTDTGGGTTTTDPGCEGEASGPANSHGHKVTIPAADVAAGAAKSYSTTGGSHDHTINVSASDMAKLANCETVVISSADGHSHTWTVSI
jgi:hypothetical protein